MTSDASGGEHSTLVPVTDSVLVTRQGKTTTAAVLVEKTAGMATREISGVYRLGGGASRAFGAIRERIPGATTNMAQGVSVEVGERQSAAYTTRRRW